MSAPNASSKFLQNYAGRRVRQPRTPNTSAARVVTNLITLKHCCVKKTVSPAGRRSSKQRVNTGSQCLWATWKRRLFRLLLWPRPRLARQISCEGHLIQGEWKLWNRARAWSKARDWMIMFTGDPLGRPFWAKPVLRRFSGPRIGSVGASCFVMILFLVGASGVHIGCCLNPLEVSFLLFRCVWWLDCLPLKEGPSAFCSP